MSSPVIGCVSSIPQVKSRAPSHDLQFTEKFRAAYTPSFWDREEAGLLLKNKQTLSKKLS